MNTDIALFLLRVIAGAALITHGWPKLRHFASTMKWLQSEGFPLVFISTCLVILAELVGAIMLILGVYVQYAAAIIAGNFVIVVLYHIKKKQPFKGEMEKGLLFFAIALTLAIAGGGAWTLF